MGKRRRKHPSRRTRRQTEKQQLERRESRRWLIQNGLSVVMILISAKTCQYAELDKALTQRIARLEAQTDQNTMPEGDSALQASSKQLPPIAPVTNIRSS